MSAVVFRPYQDAASAAIREGWASGLKAQLLVLPTGSGKTIVFSREIEHEASNGRKTLVLAHRDELLRQAADKLYRVTGMYSDTEKAENRASRQQDCVVASIQTLTRDSRLERWPKDHFGLVIIDEAHRTLADSYQKVLNHFKEGGSRFLGVTATPDRGDKRNLGQFYERVAFEYSLVNAVKDGFLSRLAVQTIPIDVDLSSVAIRTGDFADDQVAEAITPILGKIAAALWEAGRTRKLLVFMPTIATSQMMADAMASAGWRADWIAGVSEDRRDKLRNFERAGPGSALVNAMLLTEGYDESSIDAVCVLRPTRIRSLYAQMVGRGTRLHPGKKNLLILDLLWHSTRHLLIKPAHLIAKTEEIAQMAIDHGDGDLVEACEASEKKHLNALEKRLAVLAKRKSKLIDPLDLGTLLDDLDTAEYAPMTAQDELPMFDYQRERLSRAGINLDAVTSRGHAAHIIETLDHRMKEKLGTLKQVRILKKYGFAEAASMTFAACSAEITKIAARGWAMPFKAEETFKMIAK